MKANKFFLRSLFLLYALGAVFFVEAKGTAYFPVSKPDVGNGRLKICGQNARNYFVVNLATNGRSDYTDIAGLEDKTRRIVQVFRHLDADIFAVCEIECKDDAVAYLTNALNEDAGSQIYDYVVDNQTADVSQIKSGFIYRVDKVKPYGGNTAASPQMYYRYTMRVQAFEELSTGERFVLSMNHFKAKDSTADQGEAKRQRNAEDLMSTLSGITTDPDILLMGDLNCTVSEDPLQYIINYGYTEMLLQYDPDAYSHYYKGYELIDHVFANSTMVEQIKGAGVFHINTGTNKYSEYWYSDHDPYMVSLTLGSDTPIPSDCEDINDTQSFVSDLGTFSSVGVQGTTTFYSRSPYGAVATGYSKQGVQECWLISPEYDLQGMDEASVEFRHNIYKNNQGGTQYEQQQTLWVSNDYVAGAPSTATWTQITIPQYTVGSWTNCTVTVPEANRKANFRFAFKYEAPEGGQGNYWEIDHATLTAKCSTMGTGVEQTEQEGTAIDIHDAATRVYSITGYDMTASRDNLPSGIYIITNGKQTQKVVRP